MRSAKRPHVHTSTRPSLERLEPRALLAGLTPQFWGVSGAAGAALTAVIPSPPAIVLPNSIAMTGPSGVTASPASTAGAGGSQSGNVLWFPSTAGYASACPTVGAIKPPPALSSSGTGVEVTPLVCQPGRDKLPVFVSGVLTGDDAAIQVVGAATPEDDGELPSADDAKASQGWSDWWRNLWQGDPRQTGNPVGRPLADDSPALGLPDQLPATRPDGTLDPVFNHNTSPSLTPQELLGKTAEQVRQLARKKGLVPHPTRPDKWLDPITGKERLRIDPGHVDKQTGLPYNDPKAAGPHHHGYGPDGKTKLVDPSDGNPHFPTR